MPKSETTNGQRGEKGRPKSEAGSKNARKTRAEQLKAEIEEIWTEVNRDVEELSKNPGDDRKTWRDHRPFRGWHWGKKRGDEQALGKKNDDSTEKAKDPTKEVLGIMETVAPDLSTKEGKPHERLRATVTNTIQCINTLGKIIAGGAAQVFAPASACFEAISFVLQFWLKYVEMLEKLEELLTKCNDFIGRLHIYDFSESTDEVVELQHIAALLMGKLVKVLRFSVNIRTKKGGALGTIAKQSFLNDSDIDRLMSEMSSLVRREHDVLAALTFQGITNIRQVMAQQQVATDAITWRVAISKALFANNEPKRVWQNKLEEIRNSLIGETGKWLVKSREFENWVSVFDQRLPLPKSKPFLVIEGSRNSGKSYLMANVVNYLERERPSHAVAYYFHDQSADRPRKPPRALSPASKYLLWQCATSLGVVMKSMAEQCQRIGFNPNVDDMWGQLFLHNTFIDTMNKVQFYILVDGVEDEDKDLIEMLKKLAEKRPRMFRILITTRSSNICRKLSDGSFHHLALLSAAEGKEMSRSRNQDIDLFIQYHMRSMLAFEESTHPKATVYKEKIKNTVREKSGGDFAWISIAFERLRSKHHLADIDGILSDMDKDRERQISDEIENLNRILSPEEIKEINEIILWVMTSQVTPTLDLISAALSCSSQTESLMPLRRRLTRLLQANESGSIGFRLSEIESKIPRRRNASSSRSSVEVGGSLGPPVPPQLVDAEVETVHRFLRYISPRKEDYDKKALEKVLWGSWLDGMKATISYDEQNAHLKMALTCVRVFTSESNEHTERLLPYAGNHILHHLMNAERDRADMDLKAELGKLLVKLFREAHAIDKMFWTSGRPTSHTTWEETEGAWLAENRKRWLYTSDGVDEVMRWFSDPITRSSVPEPDRDWVSQLVGSEGESHRHTLLLQPVAEQLAYRLFLDDKTYTTRKQFTAAYFLSGYIARTRNEKDVERSLEDRKHFNWKEFCSIRDWAAKLPDMKSGIQTKEWLWKIQTARAIFTVCKGDQQATDAAKELLKQVRQLNGNPWKSSLLACQTIAAELQSEGSYTKAQGMLTNATKDVSRSDEGLDQSDRLLVAIALLDLGDLYWEEDENGVHHRKRALRRYRRSLDFDTTRYARYADVLCRYREEGLHSHMLNFVLGTTRKPDKMYLNRLVYDYLATDVFRRCILSATNERNWKEVIKKVFSRAIEAAEGSPVELFHIWRAYGSILYEWGGPHTEQDVVEQWETALKHGQPLATTTSDIGWPELFSVIDPLANIYLQRAEKALEAASVERKGREAVTTQSVKSKLDSASHYLDLIKSLEQKTDIWMNATLTCCLARYHAVATDPASAKSAVSKVVAASIAVLSDNDETNDWFAYLQLGRIMEALRDEENSKEAWSRLQNLDAQDAGPLGSFLCDGDECMENIRFSEGVHVCLQSFGLQYFHEKCYEARQSSRQGSAPSMHRVAIVSPKAGHSKATPKQKLEKETSLGAWKTKLQEKYVHREDVIDFIQRPNSSMSRSVAAPATPTLFKSMSPSVVSIRSARDETQESITDPRPRDAVGRIVFDSGFATQGITSSTPSLFKAMSPSTVSVRSARDENQESITDPRPRDAAGRIVFDSGFATQGITLSTPSLFRGMSPSTVSIRPAWDENQESVTDPRS